MTVQYLRGKKVTVMGLGLHDGGVATTKFLLESGANVTVTDLKDETLLRRSIDKLKGAPVRYVLGCHQATDFSDADIVIKNPDVPADSPYLKLAKHVESDISLFLALTSNPILAITGSKGKSTVSAALAYLLQKEVPQVKCGGNIGISPLSFLGKPLNKRVPIVLELSSWQLADLKQCARLKPQISVLTNIMRDHQNRYSSLQEYINDKKEICLHQSNQDVALLPDDFYGREFSQATRAQVRFFSQKRPCPEMGGIDERGEGLFHFEGTMERLVPATLRTPGKHFKLKMLIAAMAARIWGLSAETIFRHAGNFPGLPHRLSFVREVRNTRFYNDSAATIPEAAVAGIKSFSHPLYVITGGTDKCLDMAPLAEALTEVECCYLLEGTATDNLLSLLRHSSAPYRGPYKSLQAAFDALLQDLRYSPIVSNRTVLLSPGCASFEMFENEFDRGNQFVRLVEELSK